MEFNELYVGTLLRRKKPYRNEAFHIVTEIKEKEFTITDVAGKYGFNCNYGMRGELKDSYDACWYEVVSVPKMIWLVLVGLFVNLIKNKKRNSK